MLELMTFYFYDLETSGTDPKEQMIMQFAGQRTNANLEPIGPIDNIIVKLNPDVLPEPWAILTHGITPQQSISEGITERELCEWFIEEVAQPGTTIVGYNSLRFDDEFMRYTLFRNYHDPYRWHWEDKRSRWDLMDATRMTRALRPEGIVWPFTSEGKPNVKLEHMAKVNNLTQERAHTADSDVTATIDLAQLIRSKQPKLFDYLYDMRSKDKVKSLIEAGQPFVYTSGSLGSEYEKTSVFAYLGELPSRPGVAYVYDLRFDPAELQNSSVQELAERIYARRESGIVSLPAKSITLNKCPSLAPLGVLDEASWQRIGLDLAQVQVNYRGLAGSGLASKILEAYELKNKQTQSTLLGSIDYAESRLYDGFVSGRDVQLMQSIRSADGSRISELGAQFSDLRLSEMAPRYKARNFYSSLDAEEVQAWDTYVNTKLFEGSKPRINSFSKNLQSAAESVSKDPNKQYLLSELQLYVQGMIPSEY